MSHVRLADLIASTDVVIFDFDGPICGVFAGMPAPGVAADLVQLLVKRGVQLAADELTETDPMEVLRFSADYGVEHVRAVEEALTAAEVAAVKVASPTPGGLESIAACAKAGKVASVVSNNSADAVRAYLSDFGHLDSVAPVIGRAFARPDLMKPNPAPLLSALSELGTQAGRVVLIGDSVTDVDAAKAAGMRCIGFADKPGKTDLLAGADVVTTDMTDVAEALSDLGR